MNRSIWSKVCYVISTLVFLLALFSVSVGTFSLVPLGLFFLALGKVAE